MVLSTQEFENRKKDHIRLALDSRSQVRVDAGFSKIRLAHQALPELNFKDVSLHTSLLGEDFSSPHFVSSMTAGHEDSLKINLNIASAAKNQNWLMAIGSQRRELTDTKASEEWVKIKSEVPGLKLISNVGILEVLQYSPKEILKLVENLGAIGIFVHLNPLQELFQNNQNVNLSGALEALKNLVKESPVPVLVKEVGFGINKELTHRLFNIGVEIVDVSGHGGTHWGMIEALRQNEGSIISNSAEAFSDWGQSTVDCLLDLQDENLFNQIWASGGIRTGVDSAKCLALGARAVGIAQPLMKAAVENQESVIQVMQEFDYQLKVAMFCSGVKKCEDFFHQKVWYYAKD